MSETVLTPGQTDLLDRVILKLEKDVPREIMRIMTRQADHIASVMSALGSSKTGLQVFREFIVCLQCGLTQDGRFETWNGGEVGLEEIACKLAKWLSGAGLQAEVVRNVNGFVAEDHDDREGLVSVVDRVVDQGDGRWSTKYKTDFMLTGSHPEEEAQLSEAGCRLEIWHRVVATVPEVLEDSEV